MKEYLSVSNSRFRPLLALVAWGALAVSAAPAHAGKITFVSPEFAATNIVGKPGWHILDVRVAPLEYISEHLPNAVNIADSSLRGPDGFLPVQYWENNRNADLLSAAGVKNGQKVLVYSDGRDILGATGVAYLLERYGVKEVAVLDGGFAGYKAAGQKLTKDYKRYKPAPFKITEKPGVRVTLAELPALIGKPGVKFLDPRPAELFRGEKNVWVRNGHIPGAKNIPWPTFTEADAESKNPHKLRPLSEIQALLNEKGIKKTDKVIVTCSTGREASLQYIALKHLLGYPNVRVYEGSWTEYSTSDLPVEVGPEKE